MATVVIAEFKNHLVAGLPARIHGIWHILRIAQFAFQWKPFDERKNAFEITYQVSGKYLTYWVGVNERFELVAVTPGDSELPKDLKVELLRLAERSDGATSLYYPTKTLSPAFPLSGNVTFKASHW